MKPRTARVFLILFFVIVGAVSLRMYPPPDAAAQTRTDPAQVRINPTDPQPTCNMCPGTYIPLSELEAYTKRSSGRPLTASSSRWVASTL